MNFTQNNLLFLYIKKSLWTILFAFHFHACTQQNAETHAATNDNKRTKWLPGMMQY